MNNDTLLSPQNHLILEQMRVKMLFEYVHGGLYPNYVWGFTIFAIIFTSNANTLAVIVWGICLCLFQILNRIVFRQFFNLTEIKDPHHWEDLMVMSVLVGGLMISMGSMFLIDFSEPLFVDILFVFIAIPAFISGAVLVASVKAQNIWVLALLMPIIIKSWTSDDLLYWIFGIVILLAAIPMAIFLGRSMHKDFLIILKLRFENEALLETVQEEKERAEKSSTDKSRFLAATSHDLRQPLHALDLFLGGLKNRLHVKENVDILLQAQASSSTLRELLNALLDVSRFDAGEVQAQKEIILLTPILRDCYAEFLPIAEAKGLQLRLHACPSYYVNTDAVLLARMLRNFLANAIRYTDSGAILLGAKKRGENISIGVWDTGKGIENKQQEHIFDEYYQIDNPERDNEKGLGLGLAIVSRLSQLLEHPIGLKSRLGVGSHFYTSVPLCNAVDADLPTLNENMPESGLEGLFVLVVDDHQAILDGMRMLLRDWGCEVLLGQSKEAILHELKAFDYPAPDLMVVDYRLRGDETGVEAIHAIRAFFDTDVPAVLMTGEVQENVEGIALESHAVLMKKPLSSESLKRLLYQYIATD